MAVLMLALMMMASPSTHVEARRSTKSPYSIGEQMHNLFLMKQIYATHEEAMDHSDNENVLSDSAMFFLADLPRCVPTVPTSGPNVELFASTEYTGFPLRFPAYRQFLKTGGKKYSGCGPTAWAMLASWYAHHPTLGSSTMKTLLPVPNQTAATNAHIVQIGKAIKSFSNVLMGKNTATMPWDMHRITSMAQYKDKTVSRSYKITFAVQRKCPLGDIWNCAVARLKQGRPVIIGYGTGVNTHYALARAFVKHKNGKQWIYLNNGWGGNGNGWLSNEHKIFFAGYFDQ